MSLEAIEDAATADMVVIGTGMTINTTPKFHDPAFNGAMTSDCGNFGTRGQRLERKHAKMEGFEPCKKCFGGDNV